VVRLAASASPNVVFVMQSHRAREFDAGLCWLREQVLATARDVAHG
jgi:hypothetical protein